MKNENSRLVPLVRDMVLIGGGHAHALVLRGLAMRPIPGVRVTVINPEATAPYSGMLPGLVAGHYGQADLQIDLVRLARAAGARLVMDRAIGLDRAAGRVLLADRPPLAYDVAALDIGITSDLPDLPGFAAHAVPAKPLGPMAAAWQAHAALSQPGPVVILGGGVAGVELAMACAHRLGARAPVTIIDRGALVEELSPATRKTLLDTLKALGVRCLAKTTVRAVTEDHVLLGDGQVVPAALVLGAAGARAQAWLAQTGLTLRDGFVVVDPLLRSSDPAIYAAGDCAYMAASPRPKAGVFAVRQAPILLHNLRADLTGGSPRPYRPQRDYLKLISLGGKRAVADKAGFRLAGPMLWRLKDKIDRDFMRKFDDLPVMAAAPVPEGAATGVAAALAEPALCGGCGAKIGSDALDRALAQVPGPQRADVLSRPGDDAAILAHGDGVQVLTSDHLRALVDDPWTLARIALIHALGDVWAMGAQPQAVLSSVVLPAMSERLQTETLREILAAVTDILTPLGADLVGGHSTQGAELTLGFTVTGLARRAVLQSGARPGDRLILTRPIGTGVLFAGEMQRRAKGGDIAAMIACMTRPQDDAAAVLAPVAHAMTDVTGFGLAGHIARLCAASGTGAVIDPLAVPHYAGALDLAKGGVRSSLYAANRRIAPDWADADPRIALLFDPQTCGGLLAAVPPQAVASCLASLEGAALIGQITDQPGLAMQTAQP